MKKIALVFLLLGSLFANENSDYIGFGAGNTEFKTTTGKSNGTDFSVKLGHYYGDSGRLSLNYSYVDSASHIDKSSLVLLSYDYIVPLYDDVFLLYFGPVAGYTSLSDANVNLSSSNYGAQTGFIVNFFDDYEAEIGARYLGQSSELLDSTTMIYFNMNIRFDVKSAFNL